MKLVTIITAIQAGYTRVKAWGSRNVVALTATAGTLLLGLHPHVAHADDLDDVLSSAATNLQSYGGKVAIGMIVVVAFFIAIGLVIRYAKKASKSS